MKTVDNNFRFAAGSNYLRNNRYSGKSDEVWQFNEATLNLSFVNDSLQLAGYVQFYSPQRNEPGKPLQVILKKGMNNKTVESNTGFNLKLYPNPASDQAGVQFTINATSTVSIQLYALNGVLIFSEKEKLLPAGVYTFPVPVKGLAAGTYDVKVIINNSPFTKTLVKQ